MFDFGLNIYFGFFKGGPAWLTVLHANSGSDILIG